MSGPKVAVLIPTLNNHKELDIVLESLTNQTWKGELEIAVVGPTNDPGGKITTDHNATWIDDEGSRNRADACNIGIKALKCDILLFTDDDVIPPSDWVATLVRWFEREEVAGVGGQNWAPESDPFLAKVTDVAFGAKYVTAGTRYGKVMQGELIEVDHNPGCNSAYRKSVLDEIDGFEKGCIGAEDVVLDHKIRSNGHKLWFDPESIMPHRRRVPPALFKQMKNYGPWAFVVDSEDFELESSPGASCQVQEEEERPIFLFSEPFELRGELETGESLRWCEGVGVVGTVWGPERLRASWWRQPVVRDYYVVELDDGARLWVFRDLRNQLYLHGLFD